MNRIQSLFLAVLISGSYANSVASNDTRILVELPEMMQQHMLSNMRDHLAAINEILVYLNNDELEKAAETAEFRLGMSSLNSHGADQMAKFSSKPIRTESTGGRGIAGVQSALGYYFCLCGMPFGLQDQMTNSPDKQMQSNAVAPRC